MKNGNQSLRIDETGNTYGKLTVLGFAFTKTVSQKSYDQENGGRKLAYWRCRCDCGRESDICGKELRRKDHKAVRSCGQCHRISHGHCAGGEQSPTYVSWHSMITRCTLPEYDGYADYGGRVISVCDRWLSFSAFLTDMGNRPSNNHKIERTNNNGNYELGNCRWATQKEQNRNMRSNVVVEHNGQSMILTDWFEKLGVPVTTYYTRRRRGKTIKESLGLE